MTNDGTIILVEDDKDDIEVIAGIINESFSNHELKVLDTLEEVFAYLSSEAEKPFIIICDNNWRNRNQDKFEKLIHKYPLLKLKSIPFIFYSASPQNELIVNAFEHLNVQGYFQKHSTYEEIRQDLKAIINYWERSVKTVNLPEDIH